MDPATHCLHYGQEIFEGLKAYRNEADDVLMFRPMDNLNRMNKSAERMSMPTIDVEFVQKALFELIRLEKDWIPTIPGASLYIRPTMMATASQLGVRAGSSYKFFIILSPVGPYFGDKVTAIDLLVEDTYSRCAMGGTGEAKCAGNYAAGMLAAEEAVRKGFNQVLWLDAAEKKYVEEAGVMNIFFVIGDEIVTPSLTGTILRGITRDSIIKFMSHAGHKVTERMITIDELAEESKKGNLKECFAVGTAAVVAPIGRLHYKGMDMIINNQEVGPISMSALENLTGIQKGIKPDPFNWVVRL
jgi:branched-chain amino acid aminotransferase